MIKIHYFAGLKELTGKSEEQLPFTHIHVHELLDWFRIQYAGSGKIPILVAINEQYALSDQRIVAGDVVALIPPVSGG